MRSKCAFGFYAYRRWVGPRRCLKTERGRRSLERESDIPRPTDTDKIPIIWSNASLYGSDFRVTELGRAPRIVLQKMGHTAHSRRQVCVSPTTTPTNPRGRVKRTDGRRRLPHICRSRAFDKAITNRSPLYNTLLARDKIWCE